MEYRLLEKTELWIRPVKLIGADLGACAQAAAQVLGLGPGDVMVTDVLEDRLTLDILVPTIRAEKIIARKKALLTALGVIPGVHISDDTEIHSDGILGLISMDEKNAEDLLEQSRAIGARIADHIRKRSMVFATGQEVLAGQIRDTNTPFLLGTLREEGYQVAKGPILEDKADTIARAFRRAGEAGYGLLITTGGIGAEGKDQTLEALTQVDPDASMPYILKFKKGQGRHNKEGVRIGVGQLENTRIVCLPGPHDEVRLACPVLKEGMKANWNKKVLAEALAAALRKKFLARSGRHSVPFELNHREVADGLK